MQENKSQELKKYVLIKKNLKEIRALTLREIESRIAYMDADELSEYAVFGPVEENGAQTLDMTVEPGYIGLHEPGGRLVAEYTAPEQVSDQEHNGTDM